MGEGSVCGTEQKREIGETIRRSLRESNLIDRITEALGLGPANWSIVKFEKQPDEHEREDRVLCSTS
jgi:hypothetical protein